MEFNIRTESGSLREVDGEWVGFVKGAPDGMKFFSHWGGAENERIITISEYSSGLALMQGKDPSIVAIAAANRIYRKKKKLISEVKAAIKKYGTANPTEETHWLSAKEFQERQNKAQSVAIRLRETLKGMQE
jgi:hypothetical protein